MSASRTAKHLMNILSLVFVLTAILSTEARAELYGFFPITNNSGVSGDIALQLCMDVTDATDGDGSKALFTIYNDGPLSSIYDVSSPIDGAITGVYFEDGALLSLAEIIYIDPVAHDPKYSGLSFASVPPTDPLNLPGWETMDPYFQATSAFSVDSDSPKPIVNAISPGESLGLLYTLQSDKTFDDVLTALGLGISDPDPGAGTSLRIGLFVQNLGEDGEFSDTFVTPIPASVILGMLGLGVAGLKLRKFA